MEASLNKLNEDLRLAIWVLLSELGIARGESARSRRVWSKQVGEKCVRVLVEAETLTNLQEWDDRSFDRISQAIGLWEMVWPDYVAYVGRILSARLYDAYYRVRWLITRA
jgi:hypothetical protein